MLAHRVALAAAIAILAAPATALAANADGATPTATPLILELSVAVLVAGGLLARHRIAGYARAVAARVARLRVRPRRSLARRQG